jgi:1,4-dihydroxy-2-naphthoate octaprenyltransferase
MWRYIACTLAIALAAGIALVVMRGGATLTLMLVGCIFVAFYTWPMKYIGLGELAVIVVWGPLMVGGGYYVITGALDPGVVTASLPFSLGATTVIFGKHIDKLGQDKAKGIKTLPVLLGDSAARASVIGMIVLQYAITIALVLTHRLGPALLLCALALPAAVRTIGVYRTIKPDAAPERMPKGIWPLWFVAFAFDHNRKFGILYVAGMAIDAALFTSSSFA